MNVEPAPLSWPSAVVQRLAVGPDGWALAVAEEAAAGVVVGADAAPLGLGVDPPLEHAPRAKAATRASAPRCFVVVIVTSM